MRRFFEFAPHLFVNVELISMLDYTDLEHPWFMVDGQVYSVSSTVMDALLNRIREVLGG